MRKLTRVPLVGRSMLFLLRARTAVGYYRTPLSNLVTWLFTSRERANFTYALEATNTRYLASLIADIANISFDLALGYIREIEEDVALRQHVGEATTRSARAQETDSRAQFGRRVGWYALARALKPRTIIETGVDKGLGSCVLTAALKRNESEGHQGRYYGTDNDLSAGSLFSGEYVRYGEILYGDSIESLVAFEGTIDMFINDSDHSAAYEAREYQAIAAKLADAAIILADNAHCTDELLNFSLETGRRFVFFQEKPAGHWYPGAGIGIAFRRGMQKPAG